MTVRVRLFAMLRESAGSGSLEIELPSGATVADAIRQLAGLPALAEQLDRLPVAVAVNREYADRETLLHPGDELALIPPISGGAAAVHVAVRAEPLRPDEVSRLVADPGAGAIVTFQGVTREVPQLDYEAYREMAEARIREILLDCCERHGLLAAAAEHRVGTVGLGDPAVVVAASSPHREEAFAGAREAIDRIKAEAPIWKREVGADGEGTWVEGCPPPGTA
jgi:molybdopterin synthase catalytic subunit